MLNIVDERKNLTMFAVSSFIHCYAKNKYVIEFVILNIWSAGKLTCHWKPQLTYVTCQIFQTPVSLFEINEIISIVSIEYPTKIIDTGSTSFLFDMKLVKQINEYQRNTHGDFRLWMTFGFLFEHFFWDFNLISAFIDWIMKSKYSQIENVP